MNDIVIRVTVICRLSLYYRRQETCIWVWKDLCIRIYPPYSTLKLAPLTELICENCGLNFSREGSNWIFIIFNRIFLLEIWSNVKMWFFLQFSTMRIFQFTRWHIHYFLKTIFLSGCNLEVCWTLNVMFVDLC